MNPLYLFTSSPPPLRFVLAGAVLFAISDWVVLIRLTHATLLLVISAACSVGLAGYSGGLASYYSWKGKLGFRDRVAAWMIAWVVILVDAVTTLAIAAIIRSDAIGHALGH